MGDSDLDTLSGVTTYDASVLQFDFVPVANTIDFKYVFSSDEYPEYANSSYNDTFAFFVNGTNCALVPGTTDPVSVNTINGGNPLGTGAVHPEFYVDNHYDPAASSPLGTEMDGLTTILTCHANVTAGGTNHMKLAIADGSDDILDSNVFLAADSLVSGTQISTSLSGGGQTGSSITVPAGTAVTDTATLSGTNVASASGTVTYAAYSDTACTAGAVSAGTKTVTAGVVQASDPLTLAAGLWYWKASYSGDTSHTPVSACDEVLTVTAVAVNHPPTATGASGTVQYSDPISPLTITASDTDGDPVTIGATGLPSALSLTDHANGTATVSGLAQAVPGAYPVTYTATDSHTATGTSSGTVTITREACVLTVPVTVQGVEGSATTVMATLGEDDATLGDRSNKSVMFTAIDAGGATAGTWTVLTDAGGVATLNASLPTGVYAVTADFAGDTYYSPCMSDTSVVTVSPAAGAKVTGGGWVTAPGRSSFGFNAMPAAGGFGGQFQLRAPNKGTFHANTVSSLTVSGKTATWSGSGSWKGTSGYTFTAVVVDNGTPGKGKDTISIVVRSAAGAVVYSTGGQLTLKGGNITVHK